MAKTANIPKSTKVTKVTKARKVIKSEEEKWGLSRNLIILVIAAIIFVIGATIFTLFSLADVNSQFESSYLPTQLS